MIFFRDGKIEINIKKKTPIIKKTQNPKAAFKLGLV